MQNKMWIGKTPMSQDILFDVPDQQKFSQRKKTGSGYRIVDGTVYARAQAVWFTNMEHGKRHKPLPLNTQAQNIRHTKHKDVKETGYQKYDDYNAIEIPFYGRNTERLRRRDGRSNLFP